MSPRRARRRTSEYLPVVVFIGLIFALVVLSISSGLKIWNLQKEIEFLKKRDLKKLEDRMEKIESLLSPDSPLSKYIVDVNYVANMLKDISIIERALLENYDDVTSAYFRILVIGSEKVWISIKKGGKTYFAENCKPGLLPYKFYYFKPPAVELDYVKVVPEDASITVGKVNRVFLIFFGVGSGDKRPVKIVKLTNTYYRSLVDDFHLYIPK